MKLLKKNNKPVTQENQYLLQEIALTKRALSAAYSNFDNATDPDLIDCYIRSTRNKSVINIFYKKQKNMKNHLQRLFISQMYDVLYAYNTPFESICQYLFLYF